MTIQLIETAQSDELLEPDFMFADDDPDRDEQLQQRAQEWKERIGHGAVADLWTGYNFGCRYCLPMARGWAAQWQERAALPPGHRLLDSHVQPRTCDPLNTVRLEATEGPAPPAVLSPFSDPYPPEEEAAGVTRAAIAALHGYGIGVQIITKSGTRPVRDFQALRPGRGAKRGAKLGAHPDDAFGATLTFVNEGDSRAWEPRAASPAERMAGLEEAHRRRIPTFVNLAPVMDANQALELIRRTHAYVDFYHVGMMRQRESAVSPADYEGFGRQAAVLCRDVNVPCSISRPTNSVDECYRIVDDVMSLAGWRMTCATRPEW